MKRGLTSAFTTWLALVALQTLATSKSSPKRLASFFEDANSVLERALDPTVPAIPDRRAGAASTSAPAPTKTLDKSPKKTRRTG